MNAILRKSVLAVIFSVLLFVPVSLLLAQTSSEESELILDDGSATGVDLDVNPALAVAYVSNVVIESQDQNSLKGHFTTHNEGEEALTGLEYELLIMGPEIEVPDGEFFADQAPIYHREVKAEPFALNPGEEKNIPFAYEVPSLPEDEYRLRVQIRTGNDREMGWYDYFPVTLRGSDVFIEVIPQFVLVDSVNPLNGESGNQWWPLEGVNVVPGQTARLTARLRNLSSQDATVTPVVKTERVLSVPEGVQMSNRIVGDPISLVAGAEQDYEFPLEIMGEPGAYHVQLALLRDNEEISNVAEYRYVIEGPSASIFNQVVKSIGNRSGDAVEITFDVAGAADRKTSLNVVNTVEIFDERGVLGSTENTVELPDPTTVTAEATVVLQRDMCSPASLRITTKTPSGEILDMYETSLADIQPECGGFLAANLRQMLPWIIGIAVGLLILIVGIWAVKKRSSGDTPLPPTPTMSLLILGFGLAGFLAFSSMTAPAKANGLLYKGVSCIGACSTRSGAITEYVVSSPIHDSDFTGNKVKYRSKTTWGVCGNAAIEGTVKLFRKNGQIKKASSTSGWSKIAETELPRFYAPDTTSYPVRNLGVNISVPSNPPSAWTFLAQGTATTYKWGTDFEHESVIHHNLWVNFPDPTPTPNPEPPVARIDAQSACLDGNVTVDGTASSDPEGSITSYDWSVTDPDGNAVSVDSSASTITFPASLEGAYPISLTVTGSSGLTSTTTTSVSIVNNPPVPNINVTQSVARQPVTLDGSTSFDPDSDSCGDEIVTYEWSVSDSANNPVSVENAGQDVATFVPEVSGDYSVSLTVTDTKGKTATKTITVAIGRPELDPEGFQEVE